MVLELRTGGGQGAAPNPACTLTNTSATPPIRLLCCTLHPYIHFHAKCGRIFYSMHSPPVVVIEAEHPHACAGIFRFETKNEQLLGKAAQVREQLNYEVSVALRAALEHYRPAQHAAYTAEAADGASEHVTATVTPQQAHDLVVNNVVALALAGDGSELLRVAELARYLAPHNIALRPDDAPGSPPGAVLARGCLAKWGG